jgi:hypothetical protein
MRTFEATIHLRSFIAEPYWPELFERIDIEKKSGMNLKRLSQLRRQALEEELKARGLTLPEYERLCELGSRPWHLDAEGRIVHPADKVASFVSHTTQRMTSGSRPCDPDVVRVAIVPSAWRTGVDPAHARVWERFAVRHDSGRGNKKLTEMRMARRSHYIGAEPPFELEPAGDKIVFTARFELDDSMVRPDNVAEMLRHGGEKIGIGACRKMGWGRFELLDWIEV